MADGKEPAQLGFRKMFLWHLQAKGRRKAMETYAVIGEAFSAVHRRFMAKGKRAGRR